MEGEQTVAAFVMEPVMSGGGVLVPHETYLRDVRRICDKYGVLLILDEVVSGFGRTGAMFGHQHYGATPDIITLAKGLTSGYCPLGACAVTSDVFDRFHDDPFGASSHCAAPVWETCLCTSDITSMKYSVSPVVKEEYACVLGGE